MSLTIFPTSSSAFITHHNHKPSPNRHLNHLSVINSSSPDPAQQTNKNSTPPSGFGPASSQKQKGKKERARIIRREPVEKPSFVAKETEKGDVEKEQGVNERAFLLAWLGLGSLIIFEGLALAASGFLPEEWDALFVKYLYPSFTPIVFLFVAGTVVYGVVKYLENENRNSSN